MQKKKNEYKDKPKNNSKNNQNKDFSKKSKNSSQKPASKTYSKRRNGSAKKYRKNNFASADDILYNLFVTAYNKGTLTTGAVCITRSKGGL